LIRSTIEVRSTILIFLVNICILTGTVWGQRFSIGVTAGVNSSQLDGDDYTGFDKLGKRFGIRSEANISQLTDMVIELLYTEKGARFQLNKAISTDGSKSRIIHLNYAEVPILFRCFFKQRYHSFFEVGVSLAYLIKDKYEVQTEEGIGLEQFQALSPYFRRNEWNGVFGFGYQFNKNIGLFFRATVALQEVYQRPQGEVDQNQGQNYIWVGNGGSDSQILRLRNYHISAGAFYML